ncbi:MAG: amino acid adenylation domain-containing protein [Candidatus Aminicenantes bacterium]|nr:amino acid adenylation domain-containing protein [Candidatus Aminicenantes bacterium]
MIIKKFEEQVERFNTRPAVKKGDREITYGQLNEYADRVARAIIAGDTPGAAVDNQRKTALLFEHGVDMIAAVFGALKADKTYVPLDISYPPKRLLYILGNLGACLILTNNRNLPLAQELAGQAGKEIDVLNIETIEAESPVMAVEREVSGERIAYILYTSGSTGRPKGVYQTHRNVSYYIRNWIERFSITPSDRVTLVTSFTHDACVMDIFSALLAGACLYPYSLKEEGRIEDLYMLLVKEKITVWHSVPSLFRFFANTLTEKDQFYHLRWVLLGGEPIREHDLRLYQDYFPHARLGIIYGQTESSFTTMCSITREDTFDDVCLGEPLDETKILLVGEDGDIVEKMGMGEIVVSSDYLAPGYWQDPESSDLVFTRDDELGRLYWTGDLGRLTAAGTIKIMGRKDFQLKVRGFRVEAGEIETVLLQYRSVMEAVIIARPDVGGDNYLCAYLVTGEALSPEELRKYLAAELPDYMVPRYFIFLEKMPLNFSGKIDRLRLPEPNEAAVPESVYAPPTDEIEAKVAAIWQEVLGVEKVGIDDNFIQLGGHSLLVISIIAKIHQEFDVELQLLDVFSKPTVKELAWLIRDSNPSIFAHIEPTEEKEYYPLTADQNGMFLLSRFEGIGITYNLTGIIPMEGNFDPRRFEKALRALIKRHEVFRTSFSLVDDRPVQVIHKDEDIDFQVHQIDARAGFKEIVTDFIRPFDLSKAPLLRASLVKREQGKYLLLLDTHHIISDGVSQVILAKELALLYEGEDLPSIKLRYRDYAEWENRCFLGGYLKRQEEYWLEKFQGELPALNLPLNYPRPEVQDFAGDIVIFALGQEVAEQIDRLAKETGATLFIVLLAMYHVLLYKYTGQEDIIIGSILAGRNHVDLENVAGMFVKTLALRNRPAGDKDFDAFLQEVKFNTLKAFENQDYPFSQLVKKLNIGKNRNRNPLFDVAFVWQSKMIIVEKPAVKLELKAASYGYEIKTAKFDLTFEASERSNGISCSFQYCSALFKRETIELMKERFIILVENILNNRRAKLQDLDYTIPIEKEIAKVKEIEFDF